MQNPWLALSEAPPYVLPLDRDSVTTLSRKLKSDHSINEQSIPEPFIGNPRTAVVIFLSLNPGDAPEDPEAHRDPEFRSALMRNLRHESQEYPFYALNPEFAWTGCAKWWSKHLRPVLAQVDRKRVSERVCVIEWFPYHSKKSGLPSMAVCPSQQYSFELVRQVIGKKIIIGMRSQERWTKIDARLSEIRYPNSIQNPVISPNNFGEDVFGQIVEALNH